MVELGTEEAAGGLTVTLSPLGIWGVHRRLRSQGWHVPVLGTADRNGAVGLLMTLASCDAEDGEAEIGTWLALSAGVAANTVTVNTANLASGANLALGGNTLTLGGIGNASFAGVIAGSGGPAGFGVGVRGGGFGDGVRSTMSA